MFTRSATVDLGAFIALFGAVLVAVPNVLEGDENRKSLGQALAETRPLELEGDIAAHMIAGADRFLLREIEASVHCRTRLWHRDTSSTTAYSESVDPNRSRFATMIGVRDPRPEIATLEFVATPAQSALVGQGEGYTIYAVRWPAFDAVYAEGLLLEPTDKPPIAQVVAIPDCEQTPESLCERLGRVRGLPSGAAQVLIGLTYRG